MPNNVPKIAGLSSVASTLMAVIVGMCIGAALTVALIVLLWG